MVVTKGTRKQGRGVGSMSHRTAAWLAWSLCAVCVALIGLALVLDFLTGGGIPAGLPGQRLGPAFALLTGVLSLASPTVGALIAARLPTNPIGWIFCGTGLLYTGQRFTQAYADYALLENLGFPGGEYVGWFSELIDFEMLVLAGAFVMLLFPDGHLLSPRWRIVAWMALWGALLTTLADAFYPKYLATHDYVRNPFGVEGVIGGRVTTYEFFDAATSVGSALLMASILAALFSLFVRLHRAQGDERQQLKWFPYAAVPAVVGYSNVLYENFIFSFMDLVSNKPFQVYGPFSEFMWIISDSFLIPQSNSFLLPQFALLFVPVF